MLAWLSQLPTLICTKRVPKPERSKLRAVMQALPKPELP